MKITVILSTFMLGAILTAEAQTPHEITEQIISTCATAMAPIIALQKAHPKWKIIAECSEFYDMEGTEKVREKKIKLTPKEIRELDYVRDKSTVAYYRQDAVEKRIIAAHHVAIPAYSDPCWHYVGIKSNDDFITEELVDPKWKLQGCRPSNYEDWIVTKK